MEVILYGKEVLTRQQLSLDTHYPAHSRNVLERVQLERVYGLRVAHRRGFGVGKINEGERPETCAARELSEETGLLAERLELCIFGKGCGCGCGD